jgi:hypothetical protein
VAVSRRDGDKVSCGLSRLAHAVTEGTTLLSGRGNYPELKTDVNDDKSRLDFDLRRRMM